jgi:hypothetical protein
MTRVVRLGLWLTLLLAAAVSGSGMSGSGAAPDPAHVEAIYPTADRLPSNTLRFYIVFSAPMSAGEAHDRLRLVNDRGQVVPGAFLELEEELWDPTGRRLTVLLDPGRIKRGLRANLESGAPLVQTPAAETSQPLIVRFAEPLDRALLASVVQVVTADDVVVEGEAEVGRHEREWRFTPRATWTSGRYRLRIGAELEDVAGNNLRRVFDLDLSRTAHPSVDPDFRIRAFDIRPRT